MVPAVRMVPVVFLWICLALFPQVQLASADPVQITYKVDAAKVVANVSRFWTSTGFCGPDPHQRICDWLVMPSMIQNIALIGAIPYAGIQQVRVHWLLDAIEYSGLQDGRPVYNFSCLDRFINILWQNGLKPGFEVMGNPSNLFSDFENHTQIIEWSDLVYQIAKRYIDQYGLAYVQKWNFESWNEPRLKAFDGLNMTVRGYLNYYDASANGLRQASERLRFGGPGGACPSVYDLNSYCWALLDHAQNGLNYFTGIKDVKLDFVSIHKKGKPPFNTDVIFDLEVEFMQMLQKHLQIIASKVPIYNDEGDPQVSWSVDRLWQADVTYASMVTKVIVEHQHSLTSSGALVGVNYSLLSNDNGFLSYQPFPFTQRTQLARFQVNDTSVPYVSFIRKPVYFVMGLLGLLGDKMVAVTSSANNASKSDFQPQLHFGNLSMLATIHQPLWGNSQDSWQMSVIIYNSADTCQTTSIKSQVLLLVDNLPDVPASLMFAVYYMDNEQSNPYKLWFEAGSPPTPPWQLFDKMRTQEEPVRVIGPMQWSGTPGNPLLVNLSLPSVALLHLCSKSDRGPDQVTNVVAYNITFNQLQLIWSDSCVGTKCIKSYEVEFSSTGDENMFERINDRDTLFTSFVYAPFASDISKEVTRGYYRVRVVDYWNRAGEYSLVVQYPSINSNKDSS